MNDNPPKGPTVWPTFEQSMPKSGAITKVMNDGAITKLPDGSAFFTATVLSKEEAMALPLKERPLNYRISSEMYHSVFEAIGEASVCWADGKIPTGVFDSDRASKIATDLCFKIADELEKKA